MSPKEFKEKYNKEIIGAIKKKCQEQNLIFQELPQMQAMMMGVDPNTTKVLTINTEAFKLFNNGYEVHWDFIGHIG